MSSERRVAIVTGATGVQGRVLVRKLAADEGWTKVYAVSRRPLDFEHERLQHIALDLEDKDKVTKSLKSEKVSGVTHVFHTAFAGDMTNTDRGVAYMLDHLVDGLEANGESLQHVYFSTGLKYYGMHFGAVKAPYLETDERAVRRHMPPNYYYDLEDTVERRVKNGAKWTYSSLRPPAIIGFSTGSTMNLMTCLAVYGTICRELGVAMKYPGSPKAYDGVFSCAVDNGLLMDAAIYTSTNSKAANHHFNISNGDPFRWSQVWPKIAEWFGCKTSEPLAMPLEKLMADKEPLWKDIQQKHGLKNYKIDDLVQWSFADITWKIEYDFACSTSKLRQAGFEGQKLDNLGMFIENLESFAEQKIIPSYSKTGMKASSCLLSHSGHEA